MAPSSADGFVGPCMDAGDFDAFYREHVGVVYRYAASRLGVEEGEDVTAEVFHAAIQALNQGTEVSKAWVLAVVKNKVIDHWRRLERRDKKLHLIWTSDGHSAEPYEGLLADVDRQRVVETLEQLSDRHRMLLMLHYVDEYTASDLAKMSGGTSAAMESALARARRAFRSHWTELETRYA